MADGLNNARALRVLELVNDFRTLQVHIRSHINTVNAQPPAAEDRNLIGYQLIARCQAQAQNILAATGLSQGVEPGQVQETEAQKMALKRIILDASTRRFTAHKIYLLVSACMRWIQLRRQVLQGARPSAQHSDALRTIDQRLTTEVQQITNDHVFTSLRNADNSKNYWVAEDPSLAQIQALSSR